jgi:hypothetical protein
MDWQKLRDDNAKASAIADAMGLPHRGKEYDEAFARSAAIELAIAEIRDLRDDFRKRGGGLDTYLARIDDVLARVSPTNGTAIPPTNGGDRPMTTSLVVCRGSIGSATLTFRDGRLVDVAT